METRTLAEQLKYWQTEQRRLKKLHSTWALKSRDGLNARADKLEKKLVNYRKRAHLSEARYHFNEGNIEEWQAAIHAAQIYGNVTKKMVADTMCYYYDGQELEDKIARIKYQIQWERENGESQVEHLDEEETRIINNAWERATRSESWVRGDDTGEPTDVELTLDTELVPTIPTRFDENAFEHMLENNNGNQPIQ